MVAHAGLVVPTSTLPSTWGRSFSEDWLAGQRALGVTDLPRAFRPIKRLAVINILMGISNWAILALDAAHQGWWRLAVLALLTLPYGFIPWRWLDPEHPLRSRTIGLFVLSLTTALLVGVSQGGEGLDTILYYPLMSMAFFFLSVRTALGLCGVLLALTLGHGLLRLPQITLDLALPLLVGEVAISGFVIGMSLVAINGLRQQLTSQVLSRELAEAHARIDADYARLTAELDLAQQVQARLIPTGLHTLSGLHFYSVYEPVGEVGGDYFDCLQPLDGHSGPLLLLGDVTGKGAAAALLMAAVKSVATGAGASGPDPAALLTLLNSTLRSLSRHLMTLYVLAFAPDGTRVVVANAGHLFPYRLRAGSPPQSLDAAVGLPLGALPLPGYRAVSLAVQPGDRFVLHTDGIVEATAPDGTLFGFERLEALLTQEGHRPAPALTALILAAVREWRGPARPADDLTLVIVDVDAAPQSPSA